MLARRLAHALKLKRTAARAVSEKASLESELIHYGVAMPRIRARVEDDLPEGHASSEHPFGARM